MITKTGVLEAVSYKTRRVKFGPNWFAVDPFLDLDSLTVKNEYEAEFKADRGVYYIDTFKEAKKV